MKIIPNLTLDETIKYHDLEIFWIKKLWEKLWIKRNHEIKVLPLFDDFSYKKLTTQSVIYWIIKLNHSECFLIWYDIKTFEEVENLKFENRYTRDETTNKEYNELINSKTNEVLLSSKDFWDCSLYFLFDQYYQWKLIFQIVWKWKKKEIKYWIYDIYQKKIISELYYWINFEWFCYKAQTSKYWKIEYLWLNWKITFSQDDRSKIDPRNALKFEDLNTRWNFIRLSQYYIQINEDNTFKVYDTHKIVNDEIYYTSITILNNQFCFKSNTDNTTIFTTIEWKRLFETDSNFWIFETTNYYVKEIFNNWYHLVQLLSKKDLSVKLETDYVEFVTLFNKMNRHQFILSEDENWNIKIYDENLNFKFELNNGLKYNSNFYHFNKDSSLIHYNNDNLLIVIYNIFYWKKLLINQNKEILRDNIISFQKDEENHMIYLLYENWKTEKIDLYTII